MRQVENLTGQIVKRQYSNNRGEFISKVIEGIAKEYSIIYKLTAPYNPEQNGSIKRLMLIIQNGTRALFKDTELDNNLWPKIVSIKIYLLNRLPTNALKGITLFEAWYDYKPDLSYLRVIGSISYKTTNRYNLKKLDDRVEKYILLGYSGIN